MRLKFSIRFLLLTVALFAFAGYWAFARPSVIAGPFITAINAGDYQYAESFCVGDNSFLTEQIAAFSGAEVTVKTIPRHLRDICMLRQRMLLQVVSTQPQPHSKIFVGCQADVIATPIGLQPPRMYSICFER